MKGSSSAAVAVLVLSLQCSIGAFAWTTTLLPPTTTTTPTHSSSSTRSSRRSFALAAQPFKDNEEETTTTFRLPRNSRLEQQSRRDWLQGVAVCATSSAATAVATLVLTPTAATAAPPPLVSSPSVCDATVSVWTRNDRIIYLLGTAHISDTSAELAASLVRDVAPKGVFVELDLKRVGGLPKGQQAVQKVDTDETTGKESPTGGIVAMPTNGVVVPSLKAAALAPQENGGSIVATAPPLSAAATTKQPTGMQARALNFGAAQVGNAIKGMYKNLDSQGFKPGNEFVAAVTEGQKIGSAIILGDQDVEVTLRRMVQGLAATDLTKLTDPNSEVNKSMQELLPTDSPDPNQVMNKDDLSTLVESMKTREAVRNIMAQLKTVAPELVNVMLTERDAYMAAGLDTLDQFSSIVAVMGIAHVDGVEANLKRTGWKQVTPRCPVRRL